MMQLADGTSGETLASPRLQVRVPRRTALLCMVLGLGVLGGWGWDVAFLKSMLPGLPSMKPTTAVALLLGGTSLFALTIGFYPPLLWLGRVAAIGAGLLGASSLAADLFGWSFELDRAWMPVLFGPPEQPFDLRMSPPSAFNFVLAAIALVLVGRNKAATLVQGLAFLMVLVVLVPGILVALVQPRWAVIPTESMMSAHSAVGFLILATGLCAATSGQGLLGRVRPYLPRWGMALTVILMVISSTAALTHAWRIRKLAADVESAHRLLNTAHAVRAGIERIWWQIAPAASADHADPPPELHTAQAALQALQAEVRKHLTDSSAELRWRACEAALAVWLHEWEQRQPAGKARPALTNAASDAASVASTARLLLETALNEFLHATESFLERARKEADFSWAATVLALGSGGALAMVLVLLTYGEVQKSRRFLESQVQHRTQALARANRALQTLSDCNAATVHAQTEADLMQQICQILVRRGGYRMCWIGLAEHDSRKTVRPVAQAGFEDGYLEQVQITWDDSESGQGPTGTAIRTGRPSLMRNIPNDPRYEPWRRAALARGYASSIALPLKEKDGVFGALNIYSEQPDAFDPSEVGLLTELAGNLAFGLTSLRAEQARQQAELALRRSEQLHREAQRIARIGHWRLDLVTRQLEWSDEVFRIFGVQPGEFAPSYDGFMERVHPEDRELVNRVYSESVERRVPYEVVHRLLLPDGTLKYVCERGETHYDAQGRPLCSVGTVQDITELRRLEEQLLQSQKLEAIGHLASGVAHDFNNILAVILLQTEMAAQTEGLPEDVRQSLGEIREAAERAANLTRQLLLFSRRKVLQTRPLDLNESVRGLAKMLRRIIGEDIELDLKLSAEPLQLEADAGMIDQVLMNLVVNARDAMPKGGRLTVETGAASCSEADVAAHPGARPGPYVWMAVRDTGTGIPPELRSRIFEPFFTTKEAGKGTGLGLATVWSIVQQHRGWIEVESRLGEGTTFWIYFPAGASAWDGMQGKEICGATLERGGKSCILLVEDEAPVRRLAQAVLARGSYRVVAARDAQQAMELWAAHRNEIELLLTDLILPGGLNGVELAERLRREKPELRLVFMSGYSDSATAEEAFRLGHGAFLQKPFPAAQILQIVQQALQKDRTTLAETKH